MDGLWLQVLLLNQDRWTGDTENGSMIDVQHGADADVKARTGKTRQAFTSLKPIQWNLDITNPLGQAKFIR